MLPWSEMMRAALAVGIGPDAFWALSLKEWRMLVRGAEAALSRSELDALLAAYPDAAAGTMGGGDGGV